MKRMGREGLRSIMLGGLLSATDHDPEKMKPPVIEPTEQTPNTTDGLPEKYTIHLNHPESVQTGPIQMEAEKAKVPGSLYVTIVVENNLKNKAGKVVGMNGRQSLEYFSLDSQTYTETQKVNWLEDKNVTVDELPYEHPAEPASFDLFKRPKDWETTYLLMSDHPEGAITIHGLGKRSRSEGCILASDKLRRQIEREAADQNIHVEILPITDLRTADEITIAPLPYPTDVPAVSPPAEDLNTLAAR